MERATDPSVVGLRAEREMDADVEVAGARAVAPEEDVRLMIEQEKANAMRRGAEAQLADARHINSAQMPHDRIHRQALAAERRNQGRRVILQHIQTAFNITEEDMRKAAASGRTRNVASFLFFAVLVGVEIDFLGFVMGVVQYWSFDGDGSIIVKGVLIAMPCSFVIALLLYMCYLDHPAPPQATHTHPAPMNLPGVAHIDVAPQPRKAKSGRLLVRESIPLHFYHFLPLCRMVLLVKSIERHDVEAIFRINSLSSFTFGVAQIVAILFTVVVAGEPITVFVKINLGSQVLNWAITVMYFMTPIAKLMKDAIAVESLEYNIQSRLKRDQEKWVKIVMDAGPLAAQAVLSDDDVASTVTVYDGGNPEVAAFKRQIEEEIRCLSGADLHLGPLTITEITGLRKHLYRLEIESYAKV